MRMNELDRQLIAALRARPRASITDIARRIDVARGTVYARLERLQERGVILGFGPEIDPAAAGLDVLAFVLLEIEQGSHAPTTAQLIEIDHVLEVHTVTGDGDLLVRVIAETNAHLHDLIQRITAIPTVGRSRTTLALESAIPRTVADIVATG